MVLRSRRRDIRPTETGPRVNRDILADEVRVIDEEGEQMGILSVEDAVLAAEDRDLDLVEVAPNSKPPVCKIMDYGRYKYTQQKKGKEAKKRQKTVEVKEVKMRIKIDQHDYTFKKNHAERFLLDGNKAKVTIMFRGREVTHPDLGRKLLERVANELIEISTIEQTPTLEGRNMTMILAPNKEALKHAKQREKEKESSGGQGKSGKKPIRPGEEKPMKTSLAEALESAGVSADNTLDDGAGTEEKEQDPQEGTSDA